jgi:DNA-binding NarL/FixJ family response regulator
MKRNSTITVFIVDDDELVSAALKHEIEQVLVMHPVSIRIFSSGEQCESFMKHKPDLVIVDYDLEGKKNNSMNGLETIKRVKSIYPRTQVLMLTRGETAEIAVRALQHGVHDYLVKNNLLFEKLRISLMQCITILELRRNMKEQVNLGIYTIIIVFLMFGVALGLHAYAPS